MVLLPSSQKAVESLELPPPSCATEERDECGAPSTEDSETKGDSPTTPPGVRREENEDGAPSTEDETKGEMKGDIPTTPSGVRRRRSED